VSSSNEKAAAACSSTAIAALVRVARHHGLQFRADELLRANYFEGTEPSPPLLRKIAERAGLRAKLVTIKRGQLSVLASTVPAILLLADGRAVLLEKVHQDGAAYRALIEDPASAGGVTALLDEARLFDLWTGQALLLQRRWRLTDEELPFGFAWLMAQVWKERKLVRDIVVAAVFMSLLGLFPLIAVLVIIDRVLYFKSFSTLGVIALALVIVTAFETLFGYLRRFLILLVTTRIDARINVFVFDKLLNLRMSFFEREPTGRINGKLAQIWHVRRFLTMQLFGTFLDGITLMVFLPVLFLLNWKLAIFVLLLALALLGVYLVFLPPLRRSYEKVIDAEQAMAAHQVETIYGIRTVKSLSLEGQKRFQRDQRVATVIETQQDFERLSNWPQTIAAPLERLIYSGSFILGCYMALSDPLGTTTAGTVVVFAMISGRVAGPIAQMAGMMHSFEQARGALAQVAQVMNEPAEEGRTGEGLKLPISGRVVFDEVCFRYSPTAPFALNGVSFEIRQGTIFGVMGRSGSGKTTVTRLLQGLNPDYQGTIKLDGMDLRQIDLDHLRNSIGVVPQENFLFSGTVRENIGAARPQASMEAIVRAAQLAGAEEFIERLARGYDTYVEEGAVNFSGGQRQRLAIARALLVDPQILILDEATSALDAESEAIVNANLMRIAKNRTVIIISHRLSSLVMADAILVLERGKFYDLGRHEELLERCDIYQSLWHQQNRHIVTKTHARISGIPTSVA
jgi:ATP-binding cassette subfamily B protein